MPSIDCAKPLIAGTAEVAATLTKGALRFIGGRTSKTGGATIDTPEPVRPASTPRMGGGKPPDRLHFALIRASGCNPNAPANRNCGEPYAFLNFYAHGGTSFDRIVFDQVTSGGYESDNHTVGRWLQPGGTWVPHGASVSPAGITPNAIPEPAAWMMLLAGFGLERISTSLNR